MRKVVVAACFLTFAGALFADEWSKRTVVTLNEPVMVAGVPTVTLDPGKYVIRLMNHDHNRNIVQFMNEREDKLFTTVLAIPNYRLTPTEKTTFRFWETPVGNPIAMRAWFPSGDRWGQEFVYPKGLAARIARETGSPVLVSKAETVAELATAPVTEVTKTGEEIALEEAFTPPPEPPVEVASAVAPEPEPEPAPAPEPAPLPPTASPIFLIGLLGAMSATGGWALRAASRH